MDKDTLRDLASKYIEKTYHFIDKYFEKGFLEADHIALQTISSNDYEKTVKQLETLYTSLREVPHCGRRITIGILKEPIVEQNITFEKLEISEPKPSRINVKKGIDHISFVPKDFNKLLKICRDNKLELKDEVEIDKILLAKFQINGFAVEFRSSHDFNFSDNRIHQEIEELKQIVEDEKQLRLRSLDDYQNLKRRVEQEKEEIQFKASTALISKLLDFRDDFIRADEHIKTELNSDKIKNSYKQLEIKLDSYIESFGLIKIDVNIGDNFNHEFMQAISTAPVDKEEKNDIVLMIIEEGYRYKDKNYIVRPTKVIVGKYSS